MTKDSESNEVVLQTFIIVLCSVVLFLILLVYFFHALDDTKEWVFAFLTLAGSLFGGITTMLAVYKTIKHDNIQRTISDNKLLFEREKNREDKLKKLKIILKYELEMFTVNCERIVLEFINSIIAQWGNEKKEFIEIYDSDFYELSSNFKEFTYELLMVSSKNDSNEIKRLLDFYNNFINGKKDIKKSKRQDDISRILAEITLCDDIKELLYYIIFEQRWIKLSELANEQYYGKIYTEKELEDKISKLYGEFEDGIVHCNEEIASIIKFLDK